MKKLVAWLMTGVVLSTATISQAAPDGRGGLVGFFAGCCFGVRGAGAYNAGKDIHFRQWGRLIPFANIVFAVWDGIDGANGVTTSDYAKKYGSAFY